MIPLIEQESFIKINKKLIKYNHIHIISQNKPMPLKDQKDLWMKIWSIKKLKKAKRSLILN